MGVVEHCMPHAACLCDIVIFKSPVGVCEFESEGYDSSAVSVYSNMFSHTVDRAEGPTAVFRADQLRILHKCFLDLLRHQYNKSRASIRASHNIRYICCWIYLTIQDIQNSANRDVAVVASSYTRCPYRRLASIHRS